VGLIGCPKTSVRKYHYSLCKNPQQTSKVIPTVHCHTILIIVVSFLKSYHYMIVKRSDDRPSNTKWPLPQCPPYMCTIMWHLTVAGRGKHIPTFLHKTVLHICVLLLQLLSEQRVRRQGLANTNTVGFQDKWSCNKQDSMNG